ncbi:hypothetical protein EVG20_g1280 [Dentipellis fragilis]|uniref:Cation/H+ exchanger transmembrane domain-containing protein n=1 Tax=Dentipellis fragilis TaxID=205917 RepID=A0A4Y9ZCK4_9AGAM|nr:hypothetical protein EVG20_g1280 [Dentipellis fragilis]
MHFDPFKPSIPHIAYACLGGFVVFVSAQAFESRCEGVPSELTGSQFGMFSLFIREKLYIGEACWAFVFGVIIGPYCANIFDPRGWGNGSRAVENTITLEFTRVVLAIGVFAIGVELPKAYMKRHWKSLFFLLFPVMTWGWFVSAGLIYALIPKLNFLSSLAVAACLTPTDPILAAAVVGGKYADKHVPAHLRHLLAAESGCNDGAAFPFLYIALYLTLDRTSGEAVEDWFLILWLYEVVLGIVLGSILGIGFRHLMKFCESHDLIDRQSYVAQYVSLALLTIGVTTLLGSDDLLAAFACGTAFAWDGFFNKQTEASVFSSVIDLLFNVAAFVFVGAWTPFNQFDNAALSISVWRLIVIAILVLLLRRLPVIIALYRWIPDVKNFREALFSGHFGPMGVGAVFIATLAAETLPAPADPPANQAQLLSASIQPIVALGRRVHTVSRTWSRRDTGTVPEWTTQTRRVSRAQDVVINRDSAMERGEGDSGTASEKRGTVDEGYGHVLEQLGESSQGTTSTPGTGSPVGDAVLGAPTDNVAAGTGAEASAENPPDGDENVLEWREGPNRVIERRGGAGNDVEVEVEPNAYGPGDAERVTHAFLGEAAHARDAAGAFVQGIKHAPGSVERGVESAAHALEEAGATLERRLSSLGSTRSGASSSSERKGKGSKKSTAHAVRARTEDEEGWASDGPPSVDAGADAEDEGEGREKKRRWRKKPTIFMHGRTGRKQRPSIHRVGAPRPLVQSTDTAPPPTPPATSSPLPPSSPSGTPPDDESARGRQASGSAPSTQRRRPRHARIDSLRESEVRSLREASPARSVRFADERRWGGGGSGASTPRMGPSMPGSDNEGEGESEVGTPSRVTFDLPDVGHREDRRGE